MSVFLYILLSLLFLRLVVASVNASTRPVFPRIRRLKDEPLVSVLIPGDHDIPRMLYLIEVLKRFHYSSVEIIIGIYNPLDRPLELLYKAIEGEDRIRIIEYKTLDKQWQEDAQMLYLLGQEARGSYMLFIDPDIELKVGIIEVIITTMRKKSIGFMSAFPVYEKHTFAEKSVLPILGQLYLTLFPLWMLTNKAYPSIVLANDGFMFFDSAVYGQFQPFERIRSQKGVEAIDVIRYLKTEDIRVECIIDDPRISLSGKVTWRRCIAEAASGVYSVLSAFNVIGFIYAIILAFWWVPFVWASAWWLFIIGVVLIFLTQYLLARTTKMSTKNYFIYFIPQSLAQIFVLWISMIRLVKK